jgi:hypothetical protein
LSVIGIVVVAALALAMPAFAADDADLRVVRLSLAQGDVQIDRNTGVGWEQAINNMPIPGGTRVHAAENSTAVVELEDGSSIRLVGPGQVTLLQLSQSVDGTPVDRVEIDSGQVYINAVLAARADFRLRDPSGSSFIVTQPSRLRLQVDPQAASLAVMEGEVEALDANGYSLIRGGESYNYIVP